jgi:hypothetical protein
MAKSKWFLFMTSKKACCFILFLLLIITTAAACRTKQNNESAASADMTQLVNGQGGGEISSEQYKKDGIEGKYPKLISGGSEEKLKELNQIIESDFNKILSIYSFRPFPQLTPEPTNAMPTLLNIDYSMKLNNDRFVSILYKAAYNSRYSAHPTELVYTTNINKENNKRLKLTDIIQVNGDFVKEFRTWDFIPEEPENKEYNQAIRDYVGSLSDEDLLMGFQSADLIGSGNLWGIYSYLTPDRLGISLGVPNYIGDHVEFEKDYSKLEQFLKPEFKK